MNRRNFLSTAGVFGLSLATPLRHLYATNTASSSLISPDSDRVLVIIQLFGGNDGLNTVVPMDQYRVLSRVRKEVVIPQRKLLPITDTLSMHPSLSRMRRMYTEGSLSILQNVGYPSQNRSHFRSTDIWATGTDAQTVGTTGWLGRYLQGELPGFPYGYPNGDNPHPPAVTIGTLPTPACALGRNSFDITVQRNVDITGVDAPDGAPLIGERFKEEMEHLRLIASQTNSYGKAVTKADERGRNTVTYADDRLSQQLSTVARLIDGGLQTKIYTVRLSGFDTHAGQVEGDGSVGLQADLLKNVDNAIAAFNQDVRNSGHGDRVAGFTYSEFGRRIRSNQSRGTDHGAANLMFMFGPCLHHTVLGNNPVIDLQVGQGTDLPYEYDYRDIYGSVLQDWFQVSSARIKDILHPDFQYIPLVGLCGFALPVEMFEFTVTTDGKDAHLSWKTAEEIDNNGFQVEVSSDGVGFRDLQFVPSRAASATSITKYTARHDGLRVGRTYHYRIKALAIDGQAAYGPVRSVKITGRLSNELTLSDPSPNPARGRVTFDCFAPSDTYLSYGLFHRDGRQVMNDTVYLVGGRATAFTIELGRIPSGAYVFRFQEPHFGTISKRLIIQH